MVEEETVEVIVATGVDGIVYVVMVAPSVTVNAFCRRNLLVGAFPKEARNSRWDNHWRCCSRRIRCVRRRYRCESAAL